MRSKIFLLFCFSTTLLLAQNDDDAYVKSLYGELENAKTDQEKADIYFDLSWHWGYTDTVKALNALSTAGELMDKDKPIEQAKYIFYHAGIFYNHDRLKSQKLYMEADKLFSKINTPESYGFRSTLWSNYATLEQIGNNDDKTYLDIKLNKCIPFAEKAGKLGKVGSYYTDIGLVFFNLKEFDKSADYCRKAIQLLEENEIHDNNLLWAYLNLAQPLIHQKKANEANEALESAESLLQSVFEKEGKYTSFPFYYLLKALYYELVNDLDNAKINIRKGLEYTEKYKLDYNQFRLTYYLAHFHSEAGENSQAKEILTSVKEMDGFKNFIENQSIILYKIAEVEAKTGNFQSAYETMKELQLINDSIYQINSKLQLTELETQYNTSENEKKIIELENKTRMQKTLAFGSVSFALLILTFLFYALTQRKIRERQRLLSLQQKQSIEVSHALMDGEEQERSRIARELHDGLGGKLTGIKINIENIIDTKHDNSLRRAVSQLEETVADIRNLSHNLMPVSLVRYGLEAALRDFIQDIQTPDTKIKFYASNLSTLTDKNKQLSVYRIIQELLNNALKHAKASYILLQCTIEDKLLLIDIEDNGVGFDVATTKRNMGLNNIETRVKFLNGKFNIDSQPGKGTVINIECEL